MPVSENLKVVGSESGDFEPLPRDVYTFELIDVEEETRTKYQLDEEEEVIKFTFACIEDGPYYGRRIWRRATPKLSGGKKPSNLFSVLSGLTGKQYTREECKKPELIASPTHLNDLIGTQVRLSLGQKTSETTGKINNTIESFLPVKKKLPKFDPDKKPTGEAKSSPDIIDDVPFK